MSGDQAQTWPDGADVRRWIPAFALVVALIAAVADPGSPADLILAAIPVAVFALWAYRPGLPLTAVSLAVVIPVVLAQRDGQLEPLMFDASLLAVVVASWSRSLVAAVLLGLLAASAPVARGADPGPGRALRGDLDPRASRSRG